MGKKKITKSNTDDIQTAKKEYQQYENYFDNFSFKQKPISKAGLMALIKDGIQWAQKEERAYKVFSFFRMRGYNSNDIKRWSQRDEDFKKGYELMKEIIGDRREIGALEKRLSESIVLRTMHRYDPDWIEIDKYQSDLKKTEEQEPAKIVVMMEPCPLTNVVPLKKTEQK